MPRQNRPPGPGDGPPPGPPPHGGPPPGFPGKKEKMNKLVCA